MMLSALTTKMRMWAAAGLAVVYCACILLPVAAFAFGHGQAHCLIQENHGLSAVHVHDDGTVHRHATELSDVDASEGAVAPKAQGKCCGLVCLAAMMPASQGAPTPARLPSLIFSAAEDALVGSPPALLYRPPAPAI
jgi:hypothetical protein